MHVKAGMMTAAMMLAACGSATEGAATGNAGSVGTRRVDVAGLTVGMPAGEALAKLRAGGWKTETFPGKDWKATVDEMARRERNAPLIEQPRNGLATIQASKDGESLIVDLKPVPTGAAVRHLSYEAPMGGRSTEQLLAQMVERYGRPDAASPAGAPLNMTWCTGGEACRSATGSRGPALAVSEDVYHRVHIHLYEGSEADTAWQTGLRRSVGGSVKPSSSF